jgi:hypothetical protein
MFVSRTTGHDAVIVVVATGAVPDCANAFAEQDTAHRIDTTANGAVRVIDPSEKIELLLWAP